MVNKESGSRCAVIIVTHNSQAVLPTCLQALKDQTVLPDQIIVVDSGSKGTDYLKQAVTNFSIHLLLCEENVGFCVGNNKGYSQMNAETDYVLFLNPDAFLTSHFIEEAIATLTKPSSSDVAALTGMLLGYQLDQQKPTGLIDSTGIFTTWYGRWYDRGQGEANGSEYTSNESVPALCGALMFCRKIALDSALLGPDLVMDPSFFMYKEDIDLSLRLRQKGWTLLFSPSLIAYHCRGWHNDRSKVARHWRLLSAKNEMRLYKRLKSPCYLYSALKYALVKYLNK